MPLFSHKFAPPAESAVDGTKPSGSRSWLAGRPRVESLLWATPYTIFLIIPLVSALLELLDGERQLLLPVLLMFALLNTYMASWLLTDVAPAQRVRPRVWVMIVLYLALQQWFFFISPENGAFALPFLVAMIALQLPKKWVLPLTIGTLALSLAQTWNASYGLFVPLTVVLTGGIVLLVRRSLENDQQQAMERVQNQQLADQRRRTQLASDLHDILGQSLTTINVKAQLASRLLGHVVEESSAPNDRLSAAQQQVTEIADLARQALSDVRDVVAATREVSVHAELSAAKDLLHAAGARVEIEDRGIPNAGIIETNAAYVIRES
ncbi:sensor histidine kinase [Micrococcoides hystricis]|uniref:Sensor histidine kinase n=1 Tax=Micrococcoides hystricis TaxID=1572761 RepID=A0ABV6PAZ7_9MICC